MEEDLAPRRAMGDVATAIRELTAVVANRLPQSAEDLARRAVEDERLRIIAWLERRMSQSTLGYSEPIVRTLYQIIELLKVGDDRRATTKP